MAQTAEKIGYLPIGELEMNYEVHGSGQPLVLLHGAFSAVHLVWGFAPGVGQ